MVASAFQFEKELQPNYHKLPAFHKLLGSPQCDFFSQTPRATHPAKRERGEANEAQKNRLKPLSGQE